MTGSAGPILLITNKGRTIRKLTREGGGGGGSKKKKKLFSLKGMKKNACTPINTKKYSYYGLKKLHTRNLITKKNNYAFFIFWREYRIKALMHTYMHTYVHIYWVVPQGFSESMLSYSIKHRKLKTRKIIN